MGKIKCYCCRIPGCGLKFTSLGHRKRHETMNCKKTLNSGHEKSIRREDDGSFSCESCGENFKRQCSAEKHVTIQGCTKTLSDNASGAEDSDNGGDKDISPSKLVEPSKKDGDKPCMNAKLYSCPTCGKKYFRKGHYVRHIGSCIRKPKIPSHNEVEEDDPKISIPVTTSQPLLSVLDMSLENFHAHVMSLLSPVGKPSPHNNNNNNSSNNNNNVESTSPKEQSPAL